MYPSMKPAGAMLSTTSILNLNDQHLWEQEEHSMTMTMTPIPISYCLEAYTTEAMKYLPAQQASRRLRRHPPAPVRD